MSGLERLAALRDQATTDHAQRHAAALAVAILDADLDAELALVDGIAEADDLRALVLALARLATGAAAVSFAGQPSPIASARELFVRVALLHQ